MGLENILGKTASGPIELCVDMTMRLVTKFVLIIGLGLFIVSFRENLKKCSFS